MNIYLIIPSYNEDQRLHWLLKKTAHYFPLSKTIVVDDGSINPVRLRQNTPAILIRHQINLGKGAAMKTGAQFAFKNGAQAIIFMDADGQHDPKELPLFKKYLNKNYDLILGSRRLGLDAPFLRMLGNKFTALYVSLLFNIYVSDILSGYRALTHKAYQLLKWDSDRYGVETEIIARLGKYKKQLKWLEIPIETIYMDKYKGVTIIQAIKILVNSLWWKLSWAFK